MKPGPGALETPLRPNDEDDDDIMDSRGRTFNQISTGIISVVTLHVASEEGDGA